jgi:hypothetical protein
MIKRIVVLCELTSVLALLGACSLLEEDLPEKDWTIASVMYWPNITPPEFCLNFNDVTDFDDYNYYYEKDRTSNLDFKDIISIPGIQNTKTDMKKSNGVWIYTNGGLPTGDAIITYYNKYFYQREQADGTFSGGDWSAKIRIITQTIPVTVIP